MGYRTDYSFEYKVLEETRDKAFDDFVKQCQEKGVEVPAGLVVDQRPTVEVFAEYLETQTDNEYGDKWLNLLNSYELKWYGHENDMRDLSKKFPTILMILSGEGEDSGDIWRKYFLNGKMQRASAKITFEDFDERKMS